MRGVNNLPVDKDNILLSYGSVMTYVSCQVNEEHFYFSIKTCISSLHRPDSTKVEDAATLLAVGGGLMYTLGMETSVSKVYGYGVLVAAGAGLLGQAG